MIEVQGLTVELGGRNVLRDVTCRAERGTVTGVIGPPEAGKSVLLRAVAGLVELAAGSVAIDEVRIAAGTGELPRDWRAQIGMAFQHDALFDGLTVFDNVALPLRRRGVADNEIEEAVRHRLHEVRLGDVASFVPAELSGGMRKRVGIARAVVTRPRVGLFDEPIAGLDPVSGATILDSIVELTREVGMAALVVSNDLGVLLPVCQQVMMLHAGAVVFVGTPKELDDATHPVVRQFVQAEEDGPL